jgi:hypothetical protein
MSFHSQSFAKRFLEMGDTAEQAYLDHVNPKAHRFGHNRPALDVRNMPIVLRSAPDLCDERRFVECIGIGRDQTVKTRLDKCNALAVWQAIAPVVIFVWDSVRKRYFITPHDEFIELCHRHGELDYFNDNGKPFWRLHAKHLGEAVKVDG